MCADKINATPVDYSKIDYSKVDYSKVDWGKVDYSKVDWGKIDYYGKHGGARPFAPPQNTSVAPSPPAPSAVASQPPAVSAPPPTLPQTPAQATAPIDQSSKLNLPANAVSVSDFNIRPDTGLDLTQALQAAIQAAKASQKSLFLPAGTYRHSGLIILDGAAVSGAGAATILQATAQYNSALILTGDNSSLSDVLTTVNASNRSSQPRDAAVLLENARGASVNRVHVQGAASNGIRIHGSSQCTLAQCLVNGSNADGIALVYGANNNRITCCQVSNASDDSFSSNSYPNEPQNQANTFDRCYAGPNYKQGRGYALMGSAHETIRGCVSVGSLWHGIITGTDPSSTTQRGFAAKLENNLVTSNASGLPVMVTIDGGMSPSNDQTLASVSGTQTSGDPNTHLGWAIALNVISPSTFSSYAGGGPGSNNTAGNRS